MSKRINPYTQLLSSIKSWAHAVHSRRVRMMWIYPKDKLSLTWNLTDIYERTAAAEQLGYEVRLVASDSGLEVQYIQKVPEVPYSWKY